MQLQYNIETKFILNTMLSKREKYHKAEYYPKRHIWPA